jgi:hypothetical protein
MICLNRHAERLARPLWSFRRNLGSLERTFYERMVVPQLSTVPSPEAVDLDIDVICLVGAMSSDMAIWTARSLDYFSRFLWRHVWIDDGTLTPQTIARGYAALPRLRVVSREEGDALLSTSLAAYPACRRAVEEHPIFRRVFLLSEVMRGDRAISVDSDVLFFSDPKEILKWAAGPVAAARFMFDPITFYFPRRETLSDWRGKPILDHVNGGLVLFPSGWHDLALTEQLLAEFWDAPGRSWHIEQSILALQLSRLAGTPLSEEHEVSFHPQRRRYCVARHYVGSGPVRDYFFTEGVAVLCRFLLSGRPLISTVTIS